MPYIKKENKEMFDDTLEKLFPPGSPGDLNYIFTKICLLYIKANGKNYQHINDVIGALEGCKIEFYRRLVAQYEDKKIKDNGDVY